MTRITYPNAIMSEMSYEGDIRLKKLEHKRRGLLSSKLQSRFIYEYDKFNNRKKRKSFRGDLPVQQSLTYNYDRKDQLLSATNPIRGLADESFTYDSAGNRLRKASQTEDSLYNSNNQLTDDKTYLYSYDDNGNLIQKTKKSNKETTRYEWDIENLLTRVTKHEDDRTKTATEIITYAYDALGRRIEKNINGKITSYIYDGENILAEFNASHLLKTAYVHGVGIDEPLAMVKEKRENDQEEELVPYYYHRDGLGSITSITNKDGKEVEKYVYSAFGKVNIYDENNEEIESSALENPYAFTSREYDSETGLSYHRARYYNPETGTWISEDPIEFNSGDQNLYRYAFNNPLNWVDLDGEIPQLAILVLTFCTVAYLNYNSFIEFLKPKTFEDFQKAYPAFERQRCLKIEEQKDKPNTIDELINEIEKCTNLN